MTNRDKYLKDGVNIEELAKKIVGFESKVIAGNDVYWIGIQKQVEKIERFFNQPVKPTLTEDEEVILRNIDKKIFSDIGRSRKSDCNGLYVRYLEDDCCVYTLKGFEHLFQFIQPRRRI